MLGILWGVYLLFIVQTVAIITYHMGKLCGTTVSSLDDYGRISFRYDPLNSTHRDCSLEVSTLPKYISIVFTEMNLHNTYCNEENVSVAKPYYYEEKDLRFKFQGIPLPLCKTNIPWPSYPSAVLNTESSSMKVRFQGGPGTTANTGFKLVFAGCYESVVRCWPGEYRCSNDRCIPRAAHNCDGIDWCGDQSGCKDTVNMGLIGGLCGVIGAVLIAVIIGCIICNAKSTSTPTNSHASYTASRTYRPDVTSQIVARREQNDRHVSRFEHGDVTPQNAPEPPSYTSVLNTNTNNSDVRPHAREGLPYGQSQQDASSETGNQITENQTDSYMPPPPDYDMVIHYKDIYKVSEPKPTDV